ncbi:hypothetical protein CIHG_04125 [Coccidioides immitis H538.4]|uniref:Uncharacterized protein n=3 Tax=Coccidioides immitis TaxID=5501 RepID=A0A0J8R3V1_COCIT|nr:hypothetical protein CIRG_04520 [Coccidioides immitis RMSCC 2394]KMU78403.1 hypothetical protein CISG_07120 [Coccidioides immitis RMSCC 3703]KMU86336.1 hypothetical protein CIHG_04125 [Coccidioides immitis H538.4]
MASLVTLEHPTVELPAPKFTSIVYSISSESNTVLVALRILLVPPPFEIEVARSRSATTPLRSTRITMITAFPWIWLLTNNSVPGLKDGPVTRNPGPISGTSWPAHGDRWNRLCSGTLGTGLPHRRVAQSSPESHYFSIAPPSTFALLVDELLGDLVTLAPMASEKTFTGRNPLCCGFWPDEWG